MLILSLCFSLGILLTNIHLDCPHRIYNLYTTSTPINYNAWVSPGEILLCNVACSQNVIYLSRFVCAITKLFFASSAVHPFVEHQNSLVCEPQRTEHHGKWTAPMYTEKHHTIILSIVNIQLFSVCFKLERIRATFSIHSMNGTVHWFHTFRHNFFLKVCCARNEKRLPIDYETHRLQFGYVRLCACVFACALHEFKSM